MNREDLLAFANFYKMFKKKSKPEVITIDSDSDDTNSNSQALNCSCHNAETTDSKKGTKPSLLKDDSTNPVLKQSICVDKSGNVRVLTKFTNVNTKVNEQSGAPTSYRDKRRNDEPKTCMKPILISKRPTSSPPAKQKYIKADSMSETSDSSPAKIIKLEKSTVEIKCSSMSIIPLGQSQPNQIVPNQLLFDDGISSRIIDSGIIKNEKDPELISKSCAGNEMPGPSTKTSSPCFSLTDMRDVKDLFHICEKYAKDDKDSVVMERLQKKLKAVVVDSFEEYEVTYKEYVKNIHDKISKAPGELHMHLHELFNEVKSCRKSKVVSNQKNQHLAMPSTSSAILNSNSDKMPTTDESDCDSKIQAKIKVVEHKIKVLTKRIRILNKKEMSLDEMTDESPFAQIASIEKKIMKLWGYLCKLTDRSTSTSRFIDVKFKFEGTQYPEINKAIVRLVKNLKPEVPDYIDVNKVVANCNGKYGLHISKQDIDELAQKILNMVIEELRKRRKNDLSDTLECYMEYRPESAPTEDPAKTDEELRRKLEESKMLGRKKIDQVMSHFAQKQDMKEKEDPEKAEKERRVGLEEHDDDDEYDESETESMDETTMNEILENESEDADKDNDGDDKTALNELKDNPSVGKESEQEDEDESESSEFDEEDLNVDDSDEFSQPAKKKKLDSNEDSSNLKIVSVEGAGNLFYTYDHNGRENFSHYKKGEEDSSESEVITLD